MIGAKSNFRYSRLARLIECARRYRRVCEGDLAPANQPLLTVMNTSKLIAKAHIPQSEAAGLKVGNPAELRVPGVDDPVKGRVSLVSPALDPGSTTIEEWVEASQPNEAVKAGMTMEGSMIS